MLAVLLVELRAELIDESASSPHGGMCGGKPWSCEARGVAKRPRQGDAGELALWPIHKMRTLKKPAAATAAQLAEGRKPAAVLLMTGGMNPIHLGHVALLHNAKARLERAGFAVLCAWLSPSHDAYLQPKAAALHTIGLSSEFRLQLASRAVADDPFIAVAAWEARQPIGEEDDWPDFPVVCAALERELAATVQSDDECAPKVFYCCGTDHARKCSLLCGMGRVGVVVVPRHGDTTPDENLEASVYVAEPAAGPVAELSSTRVRKALQERDAGFLASALSADAASFLLQPTLEDLTRFRDDFEQIHPGSTGRRTVEVGSGGRDGLGKREKSLSLWS